VGLVMIVSKKKGPEIATFLKKKKETAFVMGEVVRRGKGAR
jgi:phosphoribosylaminoimidazole (AIR) synthetase